MIGPCQSNGPRGPDTSLAGFVGETYWIYFAWSLRYLDAMHNLMAFRTSVKLLVNRVPNEEIKPPKNGWCTSCVWTICSCLAFTFKVWTHHARHQLRFQLEIRHQELATWGLKSMRACNMHSSVNTCCILRLARTKSSCQVALASQPNASRPTLVKEPCAQKLATLAWQASGLSMQASDVTAV